MGLFVDASALVLVLVFWCSVTDHLFWGRGYAH